MGESDLMQAMLRCITGRSLAPEKIAEELMIDVRIVKRYVVPSLRQFVPQSSFAIRREYEFAPKRAASLRGVDGFLVPVSRFKAFDSYAMSMGYTLLIDRTGRVSAWLDGMTSDEDEPELGDFEDTADPGGDDFWHGWEAEQDLVAIIARNGSV